MDKKKNNKDSLMQVNFLELLLLLFLGLKLADKIDWSWWWVFSPVWIPLAFVVVVAGIGFIIALMTPKKK